MCHALAVQCLAPLPSVLQCWFKSIGNAARANPHQSQPCFAVFPKDWHMFLHWWRGCLCLGWAGYVAKPSSRPWYDKIGLNWLSLTQSLAEAFLKNVPTVPSIYCVYKRWSAVNGLAAGGLFSAVPVSSVAKSPDMSLLHFFPVTDERSGRTPIWACQRMGLPSSLSGEKKEIQTGSVSCWWEHKTFVTPSHLMCFLFILHTNQPRDRSRRTKGSQCCHRAAATCAFPQPCTCCQRPVQCWCLEGDGSSLAQPPCTLCGWQTHPHI